MEKKKPCQKPNKRYIAFQAKSSDASHNIESICRKKIGDSGMKKGYVKVISERSTRNKGLLRVTPRYMHAVMDALTHDHTLDIKTLGVSGTIKKAYGKYIAS